MEERDVISVEPWVIVIVAAVWGAAVLIKDWNDRSK